jgi:CRISPR-associated endonuclease/helicase Cas3
VSALPDFRAFFFALWEREPFPWQTMLAEQVAVGHWPVALDLPTASGKTACIEIALFALTMQASRKLAERTAARRVWFVVDRRIVVDEAFDRAQAIASKLCEAKDGPVREIADRLRNIAGTDRPLAVARLRGGVFRDDGWARLPSQPAVITSTVDQIGSRLLFRGYGRSNLAAPIFAGLTANDSLVILDEAHCSVPFLQTLRAVERYRAQPWAHAPLPAPFAFVVMSATPPTEIPESDVFPGANRDKALDHPMLHARLRDVKKQAELVPVKSKSTDGDDPFVNKAAQLAAAFVNEGKRRVAVMVNRVASAGAVADALTAQGDPKFDVVLLTGRLRPYERDQLVEIWKPFLKADSPGDPPKPIVVVTTQCLEVGADCSFDALVTEAASLDALRQRFGRLDRMGTAKTSHAFILIRDRDVDLEQAEPDRVYGKALSKTWQLLNDLAGPPEPRSVDFGVLALQERLDDLDDASPYLAPRPAAPVLLPAHLDLLCQTAPTPQPEPDVQQYLHGTGSGAPEVRVVWRSDLLESDDRSWIETVALCRPVSGEMLSIQLWRARAWLTGAEVPDGTADVEGIAESPSEGGGAFRRCLLWRGRARSRVAQSPDQIAPGDVLVVPAAYGMGGLARPGGIEALGREQVDLWERALDAAARPAAVRLNRQVLEPWLKCGPLHTLLELAVAPSWNRDELLEAIDTVIAYTPVEDDPERPPYWWLDLLKGARTGRIERHPAGGLVLFARPTKPGLSERDQFADDDDLTCVGAEAQSLDEHSELVRRTVEKLAQSCLPQELQDVFSLAAYWHDAGKLDERFQILLHEGDEAAALAAEEALAKSGFVPSSPAERGALRDASGLPENFRHEMLSMQLAEKHAPTVEEAVLRDLLLHLVSSHHGHARPFAPVSHDPEPSETRGRLGRYEVALSKEERRGCCAHRVDSGLSERFWRLTRRYGWWGLAYLESILRLGDWYASGLRLTSGSRAERVT